MTHAQAVTAYIGLGANLGDCRQTLREARQQLNEDGITVTASSPLYCTDPVGGPADQPRYFNAVVEVATILSPLALLDRCLAIEQQAGRTRDIHWGPRTLDLDVLLYGDHCLDQPRLQVPHPHLHLRRFVLEPMCRLAPELIHPQRHQSMIFLLKQLPDDQGVDCIEEQW